MKILVLGDAFLDRYWLGTTDRVSPEAPVPVVKVHNRMDLGGGCANVAANLVALGSDVLLVHGKMNQETIIVKNRLMVGDTQIARWDEYDECRPIALKDIADALADKPDAIAVSDYAKGSINEEVREAIRHAWLPTFIDTKKDPHEWNGIGTVFFPNLAEYRQFAKEYDKFETVVLKRGPAGAELLNKGRIVASVKTEARFVRNVNGAGDTVMAAFVFDWQRRKEGPLVKSDAKVLEFAMKVAGRAVEKPYTSIVELREVEGVVQDEESSNAQKVVVN